jgi:hypothetical protein
VKRRQGGRPIRPAVGEPGISPLNRALARAGLKVKEARFFLAHMEQHHVPRPGHDLDFIYFANAFLTASVSVVYVLEDLAKDTFSPWLSRWRATLTDSERRHWNALFRRRDSEVHMAGPRRRRTIRWNPPAPESSTPWVFDDEGGPRADILETCQQYLALITRMAREFASHARR